MIEGDTARAHIRPRVGQEASWRSLFEAIKKNGGEITIAEALQHEVSRNLNFGLGKDALDVILESRDRGILSVDIYSGKVRLFSPNDQTKPQ